MPDNRIEELQNEVDMQRIEIAQLKMDLQALNENIQQYMTNVGTIEDKCTSFDRLITALELSVVKIYEVIFQSSLTY